MTYLINDCWYVYVFTVVYRSIIQYTKAPQSHHQAEDRNQTETDNDMTQ